MQSQLCMHACAGDGCVTIAVTAVHACMCQGWEVAVMGVGWVAAVREEEGREVAVTGGARRRR